MWYWYFGTWEQRTNPANWITILERLRFEILGLSGIALLIVGLVFAKKNRAYWWSLSWLIGTILYVCIFFNLNVHHNYYQMPLIASLAIFMAMGVQRLIGFTSQKSNKSFACSDPSCAVCCGKHPVCRSQLLHYRTDV